MARKDGRRRALSIAAAGVAAASGIVAAQEAARPGPPELPDLPTPILTVADRHKSVAGLEFSDLASAAFQLDDSDWVIQTQMSRPLVEGMFTVVELEWDCDGQRSTTELETRAAVGSRFHPNAYAPAAGTAPMQLARASWASPFDETRGDPLAAPRGTLTNWAALATPPIGGSRIEFRVPRHLPDRRGLLTATSRGAFRLKTTTTCSEHPLTFDYAISDAGRDIKVDGNVSEWSGGPYAQDGKGELHPAVAHMDLKEVWCEHGKDCVFVRVDFAVPGFGRVSRSDGDVVVEDELVIRLEPVGAGYMDPVVLRVPATSAAGEIGGERLFEPRRVPGETLPRFDAEVTGRYACGGSTVEVRIPRRPEQTRFRVVVWTDAIRVDELAGSWREIPR
jgi:hypothetical protein